MRVLLDTCTLLWLAADAGRLSPRIREVLDDDRNDLFISAVSPLEIGIAVNKGRIELKMPVVPWCEEAIDRFALQPLNVTWQIGLASTQLPQLHADPFDRIIIATAQSYAASIATPDHLISRYPNTVAIW
jgi:PIN domain nuclease of toxin-antitoxin system